MNGIMKSHQASKHGLAADNSQLDPKADQGPPGSTLNKQIGSSDDVNDGSLPSTPVMRAQGRRPAGRSLIMMNNSSNLMPDPEAIQHDLMQYEEEIYKREAKAIAEISAETNLGKQVTFSITKILISLILVILITDPLFSTDTYVPNYTPQSASFGMLVA